MSKQIGKSIFAVAAGFLTVFILSIVTDILMTITKVFPPQSNPQAFLWWMLLIALTYRTIYTIAGGYVTAALAPSQPMKVVKVSAAIGVVFAVVGLIANWSVAQQNGVWYPIALVLFSYPSVWYGGVLKTRKK